MFLTYLGHINVYPSAIGYHQNPYLFLVGKGDFDILYCFTEEAQELKVLLQNEQCLQSRWISSHATRKSMKILEDTFMSATF